METNKINNEKFTKKVKCFCGYCKHTFIKNLIYKKDIKTGIEKLYTSAIKCERCNNFLEKFDCWEVTK